MKTPANKQTDISSYRKQSGFLLTVNWPATIAEWRDGWDKYLIEKLKIHQNTFRIQNNFFSLQLNELINLKCVA